MTGTPLPDELLARVAEAMFAAINGDKSSVVQWSKLHREERELYEIAARAALEAARYGELERYLNESRPYLEAFRLKEAGQALMGEIDRMPVRQLCKRADALLSSIGASHE